MSDIPLPAFVDPEAWAGFCEMRAGKGKSRPFTARARILILKELYALKEQGQDVNACLDQSVVYGWSGVFPVKGGVQANVASDAPVEPVKNAALEANKRRTEELSDPEVKARADEARRQAIETARAKIGLRRVA